ncbi:MAG TPA: hypothetical protein VMS86_09945 [Thermoanaerobaculia bacterium]|nr:hypothetical protein [Thermoanaerobaculia bacterium]
MSTSRRFATAALPLIALFATAHAQEPPPRSVAAEPRDERLAAEITVFETTLMVDADALGLRDRRRLRPQGLLVLEGGVPRRVTNLQSPEHGSWRVLIYVDAPLSRARTVRLASLRLGEAAQRLTDLGAVEVVVADPEPRTVFGPSREPRLLAEHLTRLGESGAGSDEIHRLRLAFGEIGSGLAPGDPRRAESLHQELGLVRSRVDHLLLRAAADCDGNPCLLFLVSDGFYEDPAAFYLGEGRLADPAEARPALEASRELAQTLAGYEWISVPLPLREDRLETPVLAKPRSDFDVFLDHTGAVRPLPKAKEREPELSLEDLEISVTPILQPLQRLALDTSGRVVRIAEDVGGTLETLPDRRRLFYLTDRTLDGDLRPVSVRLVENATALRAPAWVRSSTPAAVAGARVRALLASRQATAGEVPVRATLERDDRGPVTLVLEADWGVVAELLERSRIRVSIAHSRPGDLPWVGHQRLAPGEVAEGGAWRHRLSFPVPPDVERFALVVEALVPRMWGAAVIEP